MEKFKSIMSWVLPIVIGLALALIIRQFWFTMVRVDGTSMQPNLQNNERVMALKAVKPKAGSVVVFYAHGVDPDQTEKNAVYVKRVIGMPGDTVKYTKGKLYVNGKLIKQSYLKNNYQQTTGSYLPSNYSGWTLDSLNKLQGWKVKPAKGNKVPKGYYFVLGDHRSVSNDGRYWGFVPKSKMIGVVKAWSWQNRHQYINSYQP
ncbi:signal peptidase I [Lactiplantibacillus mudanjiangensis]|uniref:Signal peptidase I n=1 Tax=Lactiplantibacillus mudanjiangensis TaxID=1296538 RepID=A0A660DZ28_9LACO|nr:signal peptidase I [Lactiplantibacillus mudanjiangensis]VDG20058.1 signal peptidase I [Lactobacillus plantarum JDM1] [Lactiplantibacillus mudanjiangensis]VDG26217.1 signal peptidase I [Lactobacillus plantarum JDM1] [Lactiplantibacillus mudanjiangensis]VDG27374.1 signal peptidase I [Lactobacillus plantarum JDM1] [Lactiplantibacillus mudanjiangensis]VDG33456.1 signal peptidase I [Lactobacillus plantarum JDM1] [Lactiplantibacillus mudanjiangensis]